MARPLLVGDIKISGNVVETVVSNSNLDLRASRIWTSLTTRKCRYTKQFKCTQL